MLESVNPVIIRIAGLLAISSVTIYTAYWTSKKWTREIENSTEYFVNHTQVRDVAILSITGSYAQKAEAQNIFISSAFKLDSFVQHLQGLMVGPSRKQRLEAVRIMSLMVTKSNEMRDAALQTCTMDTLLSIEAALLSTLPNRQHQEEDIELRRESIALYNQYLHFFRTQTLIHINNGNLLANYFSEYIDCEREYPDILVPLRMLSDLELFEESDEQMFTLMRTLLECKAYIQLIDTYREFRQAWWPVMRSRSASRNDYLDDEERLQDNITIVLNQYI
ncbi:uncharacterized protein V2V93DRAFT_375338 [Kockiozyma suomiensis]|uniref:uncharacterized protein n=1 Tax=Kockiozyma suomiensis TaxID=1337062 RepID=UPI0033442DF9